MEFAIHRNALKSIVTSMHIETWGCNVMVWGYMASASVGKLMFIVETMDKFTYKEILDGNFISAQRCPN